MIYGYARCSTDGQSTDLQVQALTAAGCSVVRCDNGKSGTSTNGRHELDTLMQFLREGDVLMVTRVDRLARSLRDLQNMVHDLRERGIALRATEQPVDTSTAAGKCFFDMLGVFAEFETALRRERQMEGIAEAKARGDVYKGRQPVIDPARVRQMHADGLGATAIARELGISRTSVYRALSEETAS
jgi:DNA invertase Pin-like site-specific DNA recombinase